MRKLLVIIAGCFIAILAVASPVQAQADKNCGDFATWEEAQNAFVNNFSDFQRLDGNDNDGIACEGLLDVVDVKAGDVGCEVGLIVMSESEDRVLECFADQDSNGVDITVWKIYDLPEVPEPSAGPSLPETGSRVGLITGVGASAVVGGGVLIVGTVLWNRRHRKNAEPI